MKYPLERDSTKFQVKFESEIWTLLEREKPIELESRPLFPV